MPRTSSSLFICVISVPNFASCSFKSQTCSIVSSGP
jgi:hypothetical protein